MKNGTLGKEVEKGKYEDNDIPGAKDDSEAYDTRHWRVGCSVGTYSETGPHGIVSKFKWDAKTASESIEYGDPYISVDGNTVCVIIPRYQIVTVQGKVEYFEWYDGCCTLILEGDCFTVLKFVREDSVSRKYYTILEPLKRCVTDWEREAIDKLIELIKAGIGMAEAESTVKKLLKSKIGSMREIKRIKERTDAEIPSVREQQKGCRDISRKDK